MKMWEVVGEASDGVEAIKKVHELRPDLAIIDVSMPLLDGLTAAEIIRKYYPQTHILIFSMHNVRQLVETVKELGLDGFVPKEEDGPSLSLVLMLFSTI
jgi:DNA-binding NarL/FixJ family response regulator